MTNPRYHRDTMKNLLSTKKSCYQKSLRSVPKNAKNSRVSSIRQHVLVRVLQILQQQGSVVAAADASQTHRIAASALGGVPCGERGAPTCTGGTSTMPCSAVLPCVYMAEGSSRGTLSRKEREITLPRTSNNYFVVVFVIDQKCVSHSEQKEVFVSISHF
jgi:hypothetical protein